MGKCRRPGTVNLGRHVQVLSRELEQLNHYDHIQVIELSMYWILCQRCSTCSILPCRSLRSETSITLRSRRWLDNRLDERIHQTFSRFDPSAFHREQTFLVRMVSTCRRLKQFFTLVQEHSVQQRPFLSKSRSGTFTNPGITECTQTM